MKKFLVTYHASESALKQFANATPEQVSEATKPWMAWKAENDENVDNFGSRLFSGEGRSLNSNWEKTASEVSGFSILQAENMDELKKKLQSHPQLHWNENNRITIYEYQPM